MKFIAIFLARIVAGLFLACAISLGVCAQENVVVSYDGYAGFQGPLWAAKDLDLFRKHDQDKRYLSYGHPGKRRGARG